METKSLSLFVVRSRKRVAVLGSITLRVSETSVDTGFGTLPDRMMNDLGADVDVEALLFGPLRCVRVFLRRFTILTVALLRNRDVEKRQKCRSRKFEDVRFLLKKYFVYFDKKKASSGGKAQTGLLLYL